MSKNLYGQDGLGTGIQILYGLIVVFVLVALCLGINYIYTNYNNLFDNPKNSNNKEIPSTTITEDSTGLEENDDFWEDSNTNGVLSEGNIQSKDQINSNYKSLAVEELKNKGVRGMIIYRFKDTQERKDFLELIKNIDFELSFYEGNKQEIREIIQRSITELRNFFDEDFVLIVKNSKSLDEIIERIKTQIKSLDESKLKIRLVKCIKNSL